MKDLQMLLQKIRADAAECHLLSNLATDGKQELFAGLAGHLNALALEVEKTIATNGAEGLTPRDNRRSYRARLVPNRRHGEPFGFTTVESTFACV